MTQSDVIFEEGFFDNLPTDDPIYAIHAIVDAICSHYHDNDPYEASEQLIYKENYNSLLTGLAIIEAFEEKYRLGIKTPEISGNLANNIDSIVTFSFLKLNEINNQRNVRKDTLTMQQARDRFLAKIDSSFGYEFSEGDLKRLQVLINELRDELTASDLFEEEHRARLLKKLEKLQQELHKKVSDLDRYWGIIADAGVVLGKFGNDAKPITDRFREIAEIVWGTQARKEELPSNLPLPQLDAGEEDDE